MTTVEEVIAPKVKVYWTIIMVFGLMSLALGLFVSNTSYLNFPPDSKDYDFDEYDDYRQDVQKDEDISSFQYLVGAVFMHIGLGLIVIYLLIGLVANNTLNGKVRIVMLVVASSLLVTWIYLALFAGALSRLTWFNP